MITIIDFNNEKQYRRQYDPFDIRRVNYANEYKKPKVNEWTSVLDCLCVNRRKPLRNKKGQFSVLVTDLSLAYELIMRSIEKGLTVKGDESAKMIKNDSPWGKLKVGDFIVFADPEKRFDVDFVKDPDYIRKRNFVPIYDIDEDWDSAVKAMKEMAEEKKQLFKKAGKPSEPLYVHLKGTATQVNNQKAPKQRQVVVANTWMLLGGKYLVPKYQEDRVVFNL